MADPAELLKYAGTAATRTRTAEARAARMKSERDALILSAQQAGATYPQLAQATGLTADRVKQVLAAQRRTTTPAA